MMNIKLWCAVIVVLGGAYQAWHAREVNYGPGVVAPNSPEQTSPSHNTVVHLSGYTLEPLADFTVEARVLSREDYHMGREAELSPTDLAMGWGNMSDERVLSRIHISQSGRFYFWSTSEFPVPRREIETSSANMHIIPSDRYVEKQLSQVRKGQVVRIQGYLVEAKANDGWHWKSSLSRDDTGNGACELIYATSIRVVKE